MHSNFFWRSKSFWESSIETPDVQFIGFVAPASAALKIIHWFKMRTFAGLETRTTGQQTSMETIPILKYTAIGFKDETDDDVPPHRC